MIVKEGYSSKLLFEWLERSEIISCMFIWGMSILGRKYSNFFR